MATINVHQAKDGTKTFRVRVRRKGQPVQTASFSTLKDARQWATMIEGDIIAGRHFPNKKKPVHKWKEKLPHPCGQDACRNALSASVNFLTRASSTMFSALPARLK